MAKRPSGKAASKPATKAKDAEHHRKMAASYSAMARIHGAKADLMDAQNPKKKDPHRIY